MMNLRIVTAALALGTLLAALAPSAAALADFGDAGNTTGIRVDAPGVVFFNCGRGNQYGNPSMDLALLGGGDNLADASFRGMLGIVPDLCHDVGLLVDTEI